MRSSRVAARVAVVALAAACALPSAGCYTYHVYQVGGPGGREQGNQPGTEWRHRRLNSFAWGLVRQDLPVDNCQTADGRRFGIEDVRVATNFGYVAASFLTLGIWVPLDVSYRCAKPPVPTGTLR
jgi:hypothetical protein